MKLFGVHEPSSFAPSPADSLCTFSVRIKVRIVYSIGLINLTLN